MTALAGTNLSFGNAIDSLFSIGFSLYFGRMGLQGLSKISAVGNRAVSDALSWMGFDTSKANTRAAAVAAWVPARVSNFLKDDSGYNTKFKKETTLVDEENKPIKDSNGKEVKKQAGDYKNDAIPMLVSGLFKSIVALIVLDMKETLWRPAHPLLNGVLCYISPFRAVLGQSWVADGINYVVRAART
jgi:hypothetical protein